jgi:hypothetical protein
MRCDRAGERQAAGGRRRSWGLLLAAPGAQEARELLILPQQPLGTAADGDSEEAAHTHHHPPVSSPLCHHAGQLAGGTAAQHAPAQALPAIGLQWVQPLRHGDPITHNK